MKNLKFIDGVEIIRILPVLDSDYNPYIHITLHFTDIIDIDKVIKQVYECTKAKRISSVYDFQKQLLDVDLYD